jgi:alpha-beta hydrolase superfamily lysophospholipase
MTAVRTHLSGPLLSFVMMASVVAVTGVRAEPHPMHHWLTVAGAIMGVTLAASWIFARWYVKPRRRSPQADPSAHSLPFEQVRFAARGVELDGWYINPAPAPSCRPAVVLVHGWSANAVQMMPLAALIHQAGFGALLFHARGHGTSGGKGPVTIASFAEDIRAALRLLARRPDVDGSRLAIVGHSIGGAAAILVAGTAGHGTDPAVPRIRAAISSSAFAHPKEVTRRALRRLRVPAWPVLPLVCGIIEGWLGGSMDEVAPEERIAGVQAPLLLIHGEKDHFVPPADLDALWSRADGNVAERWLVPGRRHGDLLIDPRYGRKVVAFLRRHLEPREQRPTGLGEMGECSAIPTARAVGSATGSSDSSSTSTR